MLLEGDTPVIQKLNGIHEAGTAALREGSASAFTGYPESLRRRFGVYLKYDEVSETMLRHGVLNLFYYDRRYLAGAEFFIAGKKYPEGHPIHTTLLEGLFPEGDTRDMEMVFGTSPWIGSEGYGLRDAIGGLRTPLIRSKQAGLGRIYSGRQPVRWELEFDSILVDKGPALLAATKIPQEIVDMRGELSNLYTQDGLQPLPLDNLLHITLARMSKVVDPSKADECIERLEDLHKRVSEEPLVLNVKTIDKRIAYDMLAQ